MKNLAAILICISTLLWGSMADAQSLDSFDFRIEWKIVNRFRLFRDAAFFKLHENAWRQYLLYVDGLNLPPDERDSLVRKTSVLGSEHVLNDRRIAFSNILRNNFDWRGWAARAEGATCYDSDKRQHTACGDIGSYVNPQSHNIELWLAATGNRPLPADKTCEWRIGGKLVARANCADRVNGEGIALPYPGGAEVAVNVVGEPPVMVEAAARDILIVGLGDSFASGEGNPDRPVAFGDVRRYRNLYPLRQPNDITGSAQWTDRLCHRSLYGQQLRAALQLAIENPRIAITFLDYACSGAGVDAGLLGPQTYVERVSEADVSSRPMAHPLSGGNRDSQIFRVLKELCADKPEQSGDQWLCPRNNFRRTIDFVFLSVGGNDIGFSNVVAWATLRDGVSASIASFFGATVSADEFARRMRDVLPGAYARLAKALEVALPVYSAADRVFDPSRVILTAYPDLVTDENGAICQAADGQAPEDTYPANQSLDMFNGWLAARANRLAAVRAQFGLLYKEMRDLAGDHGWTFAGHIYADKMFEGHGFCARNPKAAIDPAEILMIPCWGKAERDTATCEQSWSGKVRDWRLYNPATQNYPYALRQRWVRTFNDAYMVVNQKVADRFGKIDEKTSAGVFSETT
ncbi:MAG: hypothetical protein HY245_16200, partial [Rhizobiales bacterium]|nr:hypothetical protein [Hyphomicrobiales bacterium]